MIRHRAAFWLAWAAPLLAAVGDASAGRNDLKLANLCPQAASAALGIQECSWVQRDGTGKVTGVAIDAEGRSNFRSLMSELGVVMGPRTAMPAATLGFAGFEVSGELSVTEISNQRAFWNGVSGVSPQNPTAARPDAALTTMGVFLHKGIWLPAPSLELGGGVVNLLDSQMLSWQAYAKIGLLEGFQELPIPSLSVRGAFAYLTGSDQVSLRTTSLDVLVSKGFGVLNTVRLEPFAGWSLLLIKAAGKPIDFTPLCDAHADASAQPGTRAGPGCPVAQSGSNNDLAANAAFPSQDIITRYRAFAGAKLKFGMLDLLAQYELYLAGDSRDESPISTVDRSGKQSAVSLTVGLEF